jgi:putative NIF3 family GTP cyclohydrolase 1 type 2
MTYKEALLKHLFELFETGDMRTKAMFAILRRQLEHISEEHAQKIVLQAAKIVKQIETDVGKVSPSQKR